MTFSLKNVRQRIYQLPQTAVFWALTGTGLRLLGFLLVLPLVLRHLSSDHLAIWYLMQNMGTLALGIEVGFAPTLGRQASFFMAGATDVKAIGLVESESAHASPNLAGLAGLVRTARVLYRYFAVAAFLLVAVGGGCWLLVNFPGVAAQREVWISYLLYALGIFLMMAGYFWTDLLYGVNRVQDYHRNQIWGMLANYLCSFVLLWQGFGLLAVAAGQLFLALVPRWFSRHQFLKDYPIQNVLPQDVPWRHLWPMAWRSGLALVASFFMLRCLTLVAAQSISLEATASLGLALQFCFLLHGISQIWMSVKYPTISALRVQKKWPELRKLVGQRLAFCLGTYIVGACFIWWLAPFALQIIGSKTPVPSAFDFGLLLALTGLDLWTGLQASVLQTGNRVPYLQSYLVSAIFIVPLAWWMGKEWGMTGLILAPALVQLGWNYWRIPQECWRSLRGNS